MKKSDMKKMLDAQRYHLMALQVSLLNIGVIPSPTMIIEQNISSLWNIGGLIAQETGIELVTQEQVIRDGIENMELNKMYSMEVNEKTTIN